jgi:hypothetical protein
MPKIEKHLEKYRMFKKDAENESMAEKSFHEIEVRCLKLLKL